MYVMRTLYYACVWALLLVGSGATLSAQGGKVPLNTFSPRYSKPANVREELNEGWNFRIGMNVGYSQLFHKIDFERSPLLDYYNSIKSLPSLPPDYDWETFTDDVDLRRAVAQPRFGFTGQVSYSDIPVFLIGEIGTSSSSYQKMYMAAGVGLGKELFFGDDYYVSFFGGYKIVFQDSGFGAETIVNSVGNKDTRKYLSRFFDPKVALGSPRGDLATMRGGFGKFVGGDRKTCVGIEFYGELDLTSETLRIARMNSLGFQGYVRFVLF